MLNLLFLLETVRKEGTSDAVQHLVALSGSPFLNRTTGWNASSFDLKKIFYSEPADAISLYFDHKLLRCGDLDDPTSSILCLKLDHSWVNTNFSGLDMAELLLDMNEAYQSDEIRRSQLKALIDQAVDRVKSFNDLKVNKSNFNQNMFGNAKKNLSIA